MTRDISTYNIRWIDGGTLAEVPPPRLSLKERYLKQLQENHRQSETVIAVLVSLKYNDSRVIKT